MEEEEEEGIVMMRTNQRILRISIPVVLNRMFLYLAQLSRYRKADATMTGHTVVFQLRTQMIKEREELMGI